MSAKVRYRKKWEREFPRSAQGKRSFHEPAKKIAQRTKQLLRQGGLSGDPPAQEYHDDLQTEPTDEGARVFTEASRAHLVEYGTARRAPDAAMRAAAREFGKLRES